MIRRMVSFLVIVLGFVLFFYIAIAVSEFVDNTEEVKGILTLFRFFMEGAFIFAPLFFLHKLKGKDGITKQEKKKNYLLTGLLVSLVVLVETLLAFT